MRYGLTLSVAMSVAVAALIADARYGSTSYEIGGVSYAVPHRYELHRQQFLGWLDVFRSTRPEEPLFLVFPADELAKSLPGYSRVYQGVGVEAHADVLVEIRSQDEAKRTADLAYDLTRVERELSHGALPVRDNAPDWNRLYQSLEWTGRAGEETPLFHLIPRAGVETLPPDWRVPVCQSFGWKTEDESYDCRFRIHQEGLTYTFLLASENLSAAAEIPGFVATQLRVWRK